MPVVSSSATDPQFTALARDAATVEQTPAVVAGAKLCLVRRRMKSSLVLPSSHFLNRGLAAGERFGKPDLKPDIFLGLGKPLADTRGSETAT
jgi:hypothetical protein